MTKYTVKPTTQFKKDYKRAPKHDISRLEAFFACLHNFNFLNGLFMVPVTNVVNLSLRA